MTYQGTGSDRAWIGPLLWAPAAFVILGAVLFSSGVLDLEPRQASVMFLVWTGVALGAGYLLFLFDVSWLRLSRIKESGVPAISWERSGSLGWELSGIVLLLLGLPSVLLFYGYLRPRLVQRVRQALGREPHGLQSSGVRQGFVFAATVVGWVVAFPLLTWPFLLQLG